MLRCPTCERVYLDESLKFCCVDGVELVFSTEDSRETLVKLPSLVDKSLTTGVLEKPAFFKLSQLTFAEAIEEYPAWSPDNEQILFDRFRPQGSDIWMMEHFE